jgi:prepilin-type N-terminal cleavage/methylation domain-containing protein
MRAVTTSISAAGRSSARGTGPAGRGFTLAESLVASVVLAIAVVAVAGTLTATYQSLSAGAGTSEAVAMARQLIEEIAAKPFFVNAPAVDSAGFAGGNLNRATFDTIDDYHGFTDTSSAIKKLDGATVATGSSGGGIYTRSVSITTGVRPIGHTTAPAADFALVTVTVTKPSGEQIKMSQLVTRSTIVR